VARRLIASLVFGAGAGGLTTWLAVVAVVGVAVLGATFLPAHRASSADPMRALRAE
jgi:ABC-type lipoprotein release transport system permease subunit